MHAKYEVSTSNGSKVIANVKVDNRQTNKQTGQKQYAPDHSIRGHKNYIPLSDYDYQAFINNIYSVCWAYVFIVCKRV